MSISQGHITYVDSKKGKVIVEFLDKNGNLIGALYPHICELGLKDNALHEGQEVLYINQNGRKHFGVSLK